MSRKPLLPTDFQPSLQLVRHLPDVPLIRSSMPTDGSIGDEFEGGAMMLLLLPAEPPCAVVSRRTITAGPFATVSNAAAVS